MFRRIQALVTCAAALVTLLPSCSAGRLSERDMDAYLMVCFSDATSDIYFSVSRDGRTFTPVNGSQPVIRGRDIAEQGGVRDPHITRGPDGAFYMTMTDLNLIAQRQGLRETRWQRAEEDYGWGNNRAIVMMRSEDLIEWTATDYRIDLAFPEHFGDMGCAWAPQTVYDPDAGMMMVYLTIRLGSGPTRLYYAYANQEFTGFISEPRLLFEYPDEGVQVLDADIIRMPDGRWCMTYVAQTGKSGIKKAFSDSINGGWSYEPDFIDPEPKACEAPNIWKVIGEDRWILMYDAFSLRPSDFGFMETTDFETFTPIGHFSGADGPMRIENFVSPKHGAVVQITSEEADRLESHWSRSESL